MADTRSHLIGCPAGDRNQTAAHCTCRPPMQPRVDELADMRTQLSQANARVAVVEAALKPFAKAAREGLNGRPDSDATTDVTLGMCRVAAKALSPSSSDGVLVPRKTVALCAEYLACDSGFSGKKLAAKLRALLSDGR